MDNYKIAFINGNNFEDRNIIDGKIDYYGEIDSDTLHVMSLLEYAKNNFSDIPVFNQLNIRHQPEVVAYFLTKIGGINPPILCIKQHSAPYLPIYLKNFFEFY